jgi:hypothetical protein
MDDAELERVDEEIEAVDAAPRSKRRSLILALFLLLMQDVLETLIALILAFLRGQSTVALLTYNLTNALIDAHAHAAYLGRRLVLGNTSPYGQSDRLRGAVAMAGQVPFLQRLVSDLQTGTRYPLTPEGALPGVLTARLTLYAKRLRGTANEAWLESQTAGTMIIWQLGSTERHCGDCPSLAAGSPYHAQLLLQTPGDGSTQCGSNCDCSIMTTTGEEAFPLEDINQ